MLLLMGKYRLKNAAAFLGGCFYICLSVLQTIVKSDMICLDFSIYKSTKRSLAIFIKQVDFYKELSYIYA